MLMQLSCEGDIKAAWIWCVWHTEGREQEVSGTRRVENKKDFVPTLMHSVSNVVASTFASLWSRGFNGHANL